MTKRSSLFGGAVEAKPDLPAPSTPLPEPTQAPEAQVRKYPIAKTREGKRVATVYLDKEALRQLQKLAFDEETTIQALLVEGVNNVFASRSLSRIA
ncbi:MAG: ribbon-helix-helix domain-containing protein [Microvirga sp.]|jgi:hypothetical protein